MDILKSALYLRNYDSALNTRATPKYMNCKAHYTNHRDCTFEVEYKNEMKKTDKSLMKRASFIRYVVTGILRPLS